MLRAMSKSYTPEPMVPPEMMERLQSILLVLTGQWTVVEAAEKLGMSRNHFQTLMHRGLSGMIEELKPGRPGRPPAAEKEKELKERVETLERENEKLRQRVETIDRLMGVASGILRGQVRTRAPRSKKTKAAQESGGESEDPDGAAVHERIEGARQMRGLGLSAPLAAALVGVASSSLRRWELRLRRGLEPRLRRGPRLKPALAEDKRRELIEAVRELRGVCGAESLRQAVPGVSRRQAAAVKRSTLSEMERERIASCTRVRVAQPGVMRNLDQLYVGANIALIASDAHVPYRTSATVVDEYSAENVARTLEQDLAEHGAPLVLRMDRASCHRAPIVSEVLHRHGVLALHGPPRYPQYYGQHERQNRDHRAWLDEPIVDGDLQRALQRMLRALNGLWRRPTLSWRTPAQVWAARPPLDVDRAALSNEVLERAARLREKLRDRPDGNELAGRLAIEQALEDRGLLQRIAGGWR
jgi:transposase